VSRLFNEPVLLAAAIRAVIYVAISFGAHITQEQLATIMVAVEGVTALITRTLVTPNQLAERRVALGGSPTTPRDDDHTSEPVTPTVAKKD
jgi:hypothetical protein